MKKRLPEVTLIHKIVLIISMKMTQITNRPTITILIKNDKNIETKISLMNFQLPRENYSRIIYPISEYDQREKPDMVKKISLYLKDMDEGHTLAQTN